MKCPIGGAVLQMSGRQGIEIDYCPTCRGIWLDRGELDKLVVKNETVRTNPEPQQARGYQEDTYNHQSPPKRREESLLGELFDF